MRNNFLVSCSIGLLMVLVNGFQAIGFQSIAAAPAVAFEVASVRPSKQPGPFGMRPSPGGKFTARNIPVHILIETAYHIESFNLIGGPSNILDEKYDIEASAGRPITNAELSLTLQALAKDRFHLAVHEESRSSTVYGLTVARGGSKLKPFC